MFHYPKKEEKLTTYRPLKPRGLPISRLLGTSGPRARDVSLSHLSAKLLMTVSSGLADFIVVAFRRVSRHDGRTRTVWNWWKKGVIPQKNRSQDGFFWPLLRQTEVNVWGYLDALRVSDIGYSMFFEVIICLRLTRVGCPIWIGC